MTTTMNTYPIDTQRIRALLGNMDKLATLVEQTHTEQSLRVRDTSGPALLVAFKACQHHTSAKLGLKTLQTMLFQDQAVPYPGPNGELNSDQNEEWLCMRFHDTAAVLGLSGDQVATAVLEAAEDHFNAARAAFGEGFTLVWGS